MQQQEFECRLQALITRREGMLVANHARRNAGYSDAYGEDSFVGLINDFYQLLTEWTKDRMIDLGPN